MPPHALQRLAVVLAFLALGDLPRWRALMLNVTILRRQPLV